MIKLFMGKKGTGKTRKMIDMANKSAGDAKGNIVFVGEGRRYIMELIHEVRFIDVKEFDLSELNVFYGFLGGIVATNYDIEQIYIDGLMEIFGHNMSGVETFMLNVKKLSKKFGISFIMSMDGDPNSVPAFLKEFVA